MSGAKPYRQTYWDWRAAGNFMFGGTGSGLLILTPAILSNGGPVRLFVLIGLALICLGLSLVWLEIGKRLRAMNVFRQPKMSWMTRESYAATLTLIFGGLTIWLGGYGFAALTAISAAGFLYCQGRILKASKGIPAWREPMILPLIIITGLTEGLCVLLLGILAILPILAMVQLPDFVGLFFVPSALLGAFAVSISLALIGFCALRFYYWHRYRQKFNASAPSEAVKVYDGFAPHFLVTGTIAPVILIILSALIPSLNTPFLIVAALLGLMAGWAFKFTAITRACFTQGFSIPKRPARGPRGSGGKGAKPGWNTDV